MRGCCGFPTRTTGSSSRATASSGIRSSSAGSSATAARRGAAQAPQVRALKWVCFSPRALRSHESRPMLINFFYTLRAAKLPVSVKEFLTLLEAVKAGVIDTSVDQFYYMARTTLVKDEAHFDKYDRAFGAYFKGVEMLADFTKEVPLDWLRKNLELELSA